MQVLKIVVLVSLMLNSVDKALEIGEFAYSGGSLKTAEAFYNSMVDDNKVLLIRNDTVVSCYYADEYRGYVPVIFMEGGIQRSASVCFFKSVK